MKRTRFLIPSLLAAGIMPPHPSHAAAPAVDPETDEADAAIFQRFQQDHAFDLSAHRSHSSHSSHGSHRSGSTGVPRAPTYTPRAPVAPAPAPSRNYDSTPPSSILPSSPAITPYSPPTASAVNDIVRRVQIGLQAYGYYNGAIDGVVGSGTRAALTKFQTDYNFKVTGTITPEVLDAFQIVAQ